MAVNFNEKQNQEDNIKELIKKNLELTEEIYQMTKKIKRFISFQKLMSLFYFLIIVVPIVIGIIYLPPLINNFLNQYKGLLGGSAAPIDIIDLLKQGGASSFNLNSIDPNKPPANYQNLLKK